MPYEDCPENVIGTKTVITITMKTTTNKIVFENDCTFMTSPFPLLVKSPFA
jgi:hypothetical protein